MNGGEKKNSRQYVKSRKEKCSHQCKSRKKVIEKFR